MKAWIKQGIFAVIFLVTAIGLVWLVYMDRTTKQNRQKMMETVQREAEAYEAELREIRNDLAQRKKELEQPEEIGRILIGYYVMSEEDVSLIKAHKSKYGIAPAAVLDCGRELEEVEALLTALQELDCEIMLTGSPLTEDVLYAADSIRARLPQYGFSEEVSFLLRGTDDKKEWRDTLFTQGYMGLARFSNTVENGTSEKGMPYIAYNFVSDNSQLTGGIVETAQKKTAMILVFDLAGLENGKLKETDITKTLDYIEKQVDKEFLIYGSLGKTLKMVKAGDDAANIRLQEYKKYEAEQQAHIEELEEKIHDLYRNWEEQ